MLASLHNEIESLGRGDQLTLQTCLEAIQKLPVLSLLLNTLSLPRFQAVCTPGRPTMCFTASQHGVVHRSSFLS